MDEKNTCPIYNPDVCTPLGMWVVCERCTESLWRAFPDRREQQVLSLVRAVIDGRGAHIETATSDGAFYGFPCPHAVIDRIFPGQGSMLVVIRFVDPYEEEKRMARRAAEEWEWQVRLADGLEPLPQAFIASMHRKRE